MFVTKRAEQREARRLRAAGASLREIAVELDVSLSSASIWVRDIPRGGSEVKPDPVPAPKPPIAQEPTRRCGKCERLLPESSFNRHPTNGRQWWCRDCFRAYFEARGDLHRTQSRKAQEKRQARARAFIRDYLRSHPCVECGEADPAVLEFDHIAEKTAHLSLMVAWGYSVKRVLEEIERCEVVCVNCHRRRTAVRGDFARARGKDWWRAPPPKRRETARNMAFAYSYLERSCCTDCGEAELCVLDFDHVGPKTGTVLELARSGVSLARLEAEIKNCEVRCANCHRRRTVREQQHCVRPPAAKLTSPP